MGLSRWDLQRHEQDGVVVRAFRLYGDYFPNYRTSLENALSGNAPQASDLIANLRIPFQATSSLGLRGGGIPMAAHFMADRRIGYAKGPHN